MKRFYWGVSFLALGAICWALSLCTWSAYGLRFPDRISYRAGGNAHSFSELKELRRQMDGEGLVTGWAQSLGVTIEGPLREPVIIDAIYADGDAEYIWSPVIRLGQMPVEGDDLGCAIDEKTALRIFGSLNILGHEVKVGGKDMIIRGVFARPEGVEALGIDPGKGLAFCAASLSEKTAMTAMEFSMGPADGKTGMERARDFMGKAGINSSGTFEDYSDPDALMEMTLGLPGDALALTLLMGLILIFLSLSRGNAGAIKRQRADLYGSAKAQVLVVFKWLLQGLLCAGLAFGAIKLAAHGGRIPSSYLPTRWSDFGFWPRLIEEIAQNTAQGKLAVSLRPDMMAARLQGFAARLSLLSIPLFFMGRQSLRGCAEVRAVHLAMGALAVLSAPILAVKLGAALHWNAGSLPLALRALPAAALVQSIVPGVYPIHPVRDKFSSQ